VLKDGYLEVPDAPGLGIELNDTALARLRLREVVTEPPIGRDGSCRIGELAQAWGRNVLARNDSASAGLA
jgi:hypothetical protein